MSFQKPFTGLEPEAGWMAPGFLLPTPPSCPPSLLNPDCGTTLGCSTLVVAFSLLLLQNISLRQQQHWGRADPNFTSRYVITRLVVVGGPRVSP